MTATASGALLTGSAALDFILAGDARFTLVSLKSGARYTYRVERADDRPGQQSKAWFVKLLTGPDNDSDYTYLGMLRGGALIMTAKSRMDLSSPPVIALQWLIDRLDRNAAPTNAEVWHTGHCGRCGRTLTVPSSIASGIGPECAKHLG